MSATAPAKAALATLIFALAGGAAEAQSLLGRWSADQGCNTQAPQFVFRAGTMELRDRNQRLFTGNVRYAGTGAQTEVTLVSIGRDTPRQPGNPEVGDVATFRRDGSRLYGIAVTRNGQRRQAPADTPPFYLCQ